MILLAAMVQVWTIFLGRSLLCQNIRSNRVHMGKNVPMDTNANTIIQKEEINLSDLLLMNFVPCLEAQLPKPQVKEDW